MELPRAASSLVATGTDGSVSLVATVAKKRRGDDGGRRARPTDVAVARLKRSGAFDRGFGRRGRAVVRLLGSQHAAGVAIQDDGKAVIAASSDNDILVMRVTKRGRLDRSFSRDGRTAIDLGLEDSAAAVEIQGDGAIVVAGTARASAPADPEVLQDDYLVARLTSSGQLDPSFSEDGMTTIDFREVPLDQRSNGDVATDLALSADDRVIVTGRVVRSEQYATRLFAGTAILRADGTLDPAFGGDGTVLTDLGYNEERDALGVDAAGRLLLAGYSQGYNFAATRLLGDGSRDQSFGGDGDAVVDVGGREDYAAGIAIDAEDRPVLAGGAAGARGNGDFALVRLRVDGSPDPAFSDDGKLTVEFARDFDDADSVVLDGDQRIVVGGTVGEDGVGVTRHLVADGPHDFDADGVVDVDDACPDIYGTRANGCPKRRRH